MAGAHASPACARIGLRQAAFGFGEQAEVGRGYTMRHTGRGGQELIRPAAGAADFVDHIGPAFGRTVNHRFDPGHQMLGAGGRSVFEGFHRIRVVTDRGFMDGESHGDRQRRVDRIGDVAELPADRNPGAQAVHRDFGGPGQLAEVGARIPGPEQRHPVGVAAADPAHPCVAGGFVQVGDLGEELERSRRGTRQHADRASEETRRLVSHGHPHISSRRAAPAPLPLVPASASPGRGPGSHASRHRRGPDVACLRA